MLAQPCGSRRCGRVLLPRGPATSRPSAAQAPAALGLAISGIGRHFDAFPRILHYLKQPKAEA